MKVIFCLLGFTCLISTLTASSFDLPLEDEEQKLQLVESLFENDADSTTVLSTTGAPSTTGFPSSTTTSTTTQGPTSTTTRRPRPSTTQGPSTSTTRRPRPPPTTQRPRPPPPPPPPMPRPGNVQIFNNANRSLGPLAAQLFNFLQNKRGNQSTIQSNDVKYNIGLLNPIPRYLEEDQE